MDKLIEFLTSKIGYTLAGIGGLLFPGLIFIFVWDREFFLEVNLVLLFVFSAAISSMVYIPNLAYFVWSQMKKEKRSGDSENTNAKKIDLIFMDLFFVPLVFTTIEMSFAVLRKLNNATYSVRQFANTWFVVLLMAVVWELIKDILSKLKK